MRTRRAFIVFLMLLIAMPAMVCAMDMQARHTPSCHEKMSQKDHEDSTGIMLFKDCAKFELAQDQSNNDVPLPLMAWVWTGQSYSFSGVSSHGNECFTGNRGPPVQDNAGRFVILKTQRFLI